MSAYRVLRTRSAGDAADPAVDAPVPAVVDGGGGGIAGASRDQDALRGDAPLRWSPDVQPGADEGEVGTRAQWDGARANRCFVEHIPAAYERQLPCTAPAGRGQLAATWCARDQTPQRVSRVRAAGLAPRGSSASNRAWAPYGTVAPQGRIPRGRMQDATGQAAGCHGAGCRQEPTVPPPWLELAWEAEVASCGAPRELPGECTLSASCRRPAPPVLAQSPPPRQLAPGRALPPPRRRARGLGPAAPRAPPPRPMPMARQALALRACSSSSTPPPIWHAG